MTKINISIPQPCHENWEAMSSMDKGRFCDSCQKKVFDFTKASDSEIVTAFQQNQNLCGKFLNTQLNRDLVKPEKKNKIWLASTAALISFVGFGTQETLAQEKTKVEQTEIKILGNIIPKPKIRIIGQVFDDEFITMENTLITVKGRNQIFTTDGNGKFDIEIEKNDTLLFSKEGYYSEDYQYVFDSDRGHFTVYMLKPKTIIKPVSTQSCTVGGAVKGIEIESKKRTFIGRTFHSIGEFFK